MSGYVRDLVARLRDALANSDAKTVFGLSKTVAEELQKINPEDFDAGAQADFADLRRKAVGLSTKNILSKMTGFEENMSNLLRLFDDHYKGQGSGGQTRSFAFVGDPGLRTIIERDYRELDVMLVPARAWKSSVIMAGSLLEALLHDRLTHDPNRNAAALAHTPRPSGPIDRWSLAELINISAAINALPQSLANTVDQVVRDYRNFVHPRKEIRAAHSCGEPQAGLAKHGLDAVCDYLQTHP